MIFRISKQQQLFTPFNVISHAFLFSHVKPIDRIIFTSLDRNKKIKYSNIRLTLKGTFNYRS